MVVQRNPGSPDFHAGGNEPMGLGNADLLREARSDGVGLGGGPDRGSGVRVHGYGEERERGVVDTLVLAMGHAVDTGPAEELEAPGDCYGPV